jgi:hypothetical protein
MGGVESDWADNGAPSVSAIAQVEAIEGRIGIPEKGRED